LPDWLARIAPSELMYSSECQPRCLKTAAALLPGSGVTLPGAARIGSLTLRLGQRKLLEHLQVASLTAWGSART
jgi:DNA mismatch repair protein MutS